MTTTKTEKCRHGRPWWGNKAYNEGCFTCREDGQAKARETLLSPSQRQAMKDAYEDSIDRISAQTTKKWQPKYQPKRKNPGSIDDLSTADTGTSLVDWVTTNELMADGRRRVIERRKAEVPELLRQPPSLEAVSKAEGLAPQQRRAYLLRAQGLSYQEIAEVMGVGKSTVQSYIERANAHLEVAVRDSSQRSDTPIV